MSHLVTLMHAPAPTMGAWFCLKCVSTMCNAWRSNWSNLDLKTKMGKQTWSARWVQTDMLFWLQISIFGVVDFFHIAVGGWTNYLPPYLGSTVRAPLGRRCSGSFSYPGPWPSGTEPPFIQQEWNRTQKVGRQWNVKISHCLGRGGLIDGEEVSKVTNTSMPLVQWDDGWQKIITANRNRSRATCFQGRCTCLLSRQVGSNPCHLLSRQVPRPLHH